MKKFIGSSIMILCLFCAAAAPALAGESPGQALPAMSQPAAPATAGSGTCCRPGAVRSGHAKGAG